MMDDSRLIELVREHPCVFNPKHNLYKDANVRDNVWSEIAVKMKLPAEECKSRWKNIRDTYMRRKRANKLPTGSASSKKIRKWHLEDYLDFMTVVDCERGTVTNTITEVDETVADGQETQNVKLAEDTVDLEVRDQEDLGKDKSEEPEQSDADGVPKESNKRKRITKLSGESILKVFNRNTDERTKILSNIIDKKKEQHPIDVFFESMAMTVKKLSPENQIRARMQICQTVSQLELEEINLAKNVPQYGVTHSTSNASTTSQTSNMSFQSPSLLDDDDYDFTLLTNTSGIKFK